MAASSPEPGPPDPTTGLEAPLRAKLRRLCAEGWALWDRFASDVRDHRFHPFVAADYEAVLAALVRYRRPGQRFLEWGSATGVITIMADQLGFAACGIELDSSLVVTARDLARRFDSAARFAVGSFLPTGYRWSPADGDGRTGTLGTGPSGYLELGLALDDFDLVYGYPWDGEAPMMLDLMRRYGRRDATFLLNSVTDGIRAFRDGRPIDPPSP